MMRVNELQLNHVGPFKDQRFDFSINPGDPDIHIFTGVNGTGKTTVLHAIAALFDRFERSESFHYTSNNFYQRLRPWPVEEVLSDGQWGLAVKAMLESKERFGVVLFNGRNYRDLKMFPLGVDSLEKIDPSDRKQIFLNDEFLKYSYNIADNISKREDIALPFAAFAYSPNHVVSRAQVIIGNEHEFDPLEDALKFEKTTKSKAAFSTWVAAAEARSGYEVGRGNLELAKRHRDAVIKLKKAVNRLMDESFDESQYVEAAAAFDFDIDTNPWGLAGRIHGNKVEFDVMAEGLRSILGWMGDLFMRLDRIKWENADIPVNEQNFILLLDEIEVHLHPRWQYQLLPLIREVFPNAQIFLTTHSPFILNSIDGAKIHRLKVEKGEATLESVVLSNTGDSYNYVFEEILNTRNLFGKATMDLLNRFNQIDKELARHDLSNQDEFRDVVYKLKSEGEEVMALILSKLNRLKRVTGEDYLNGKDQEKTTA